MQAAEDTERHPKVMIQPEYPELARQMNMKGTVRLQLLVAADGHLKETKVLGGNPVLVQASIAAVKKWKYEPAKNESTVVVRFDFDPSGTTVK
jgi:TonB family protein